MYRQASTRNFYFIIEKQTSFLVSQWDYRKETSESGGGNKREYSPVTYFVCRSRASLIGTRCLKPSSPECSKFHTPPSPTRRYVISNHPRSYWRNSPLLKTSMGSIVRWRSSDWSCSLRLIRKQQHNYKEAMFNSLWQHWFDCSHNTTTQQQQQQQRQRQRHQQQALHTQW